MTPQEQQLVADLFNRLASLEGQRRDGDAERLIREGLGRAPNAVYALVQTVLIQDETLKRANARIEELERAAAPPAAEGGGGFLDSMRGMFGSRDQGRGSVPSVRPGGQGSSGAWGSPPGAPGPQPQPAGRPWGNPGPQAYQQGGNPSAPPPYPQQPGYPPVGAPPAAGGGPSFLGTAAASAAGVVGGAMLLGGIRSMMGGHEGLAGGLSHGGLPWGDSGGGHESGHDGDHDSGHLAHDAGLGDVSHPSAAYDDAGSVNAADDEGGGFLGGNVDDLAANQPPPGGGDWDASGDYDYGDGNVGGDDFSGGGDYSGDC